MQQPGVAAAHSLDYCAHARFADERR